MNDEPSIIAFQDIRAEVTQPTAYLRLWCDPRSDAHPPTLQQQWIITVEVNGWPTEQRTEWRDVPHEYWPAGDAP